MPLRRWWNQIGCASRAFDPQRRTTSVFSASSYELVLPPAPNTVARPTTLGACQVRLQESMLFDPMTWRANFCATKFISFVAFEHENMPKDDRAPASRARSSPAAARASASSHEVSRSSPPPSRTSGTVNLVLALISHLLPAFGVLPFAQISALDRRRPAMSQKRSSRALGRAPG